MLQRSFPAFAAKAPRRVASSFAVRQKSTRPAIALKSVASKYQRGGNTPTRRTSRKKVSPSSASPLRLRTSAPRRRPKASPAATPAHDGGGVGGEGEEAQDSGVDLNTISVSLVIPQELPVRSRCMHPTEFLGSTDPLLLTPAEKAEKAEAAAAAVVEAERAAAEAAAQAQAHADAQAGTPTPAPAPAQPHTVRGGRRQRPVPASAALAQSNRKAPAARKGGVKLQATRRGTGKQTLAAAKPGTRILIPLKPKPAPLAKKTPKPGKHSGLGKSRPLGVKTEKKKVRPPLSRKRSVVAAKRQVKAQHGAPQRPVRHTAAAQIRAAAAAAQIRAKGPKLVKSVAKTKSKSTGGQRRQNLTRSSGMRLSKKKSPVRHVVTKGLPQKTSIRKTT